MRTWHRSHDEWKNRALQPIDFDRYIYENLQFSSYSEKNKNSLIGVSRGFEFWNSCKSQNRTSLQVQLLGEWQFIVLISKSIHLRTGARACLQEVSQFGTNRIKWLNDRNKTRQYNQIRKRGRMVSRLNSHKNIVKYISWIVYTAVDLDLK